MAGFGCRVTAGGAKSFILNYRAQGKERRITIGSFPAWKAKQARERAAELRRSVDIGSDPMAERHAERRAKTVAELVQLYREERLPKKRSSTVAEDERLLKTRILPALGKLKIAQVHRGEVEELHKRVSETAPVSANRVVNLVGALFRFAVAKELRADNPARDIERNPEQPRQRFLSPAEISRLTEALSGHPNQQSADAIRLLLLTGARRGEVLTAKWDQFDLQVGVWTKPSAHTKQKREHRVPLSPPALAILQAIKTKAAQGEIHLFPGRGDNEAQGNLKRSWLSICKTAGLAVQEQATTPAGKPRFDAKGRPAMRWVSTVRIHDLRHSYASILASGGASLPLIGALLGHTQAQTTLRYSHLLDDALRAATERVGAIVTGGLPR